MVVQILLSLAVYTLLSSQLQPDLLGLVDKRSSESGCMNPNNQPELLVGDCRYWHQVLKLMDLIKLNDDCPNSLTDPPACLESSAYKDHCVAYCEQFLYWFHGPEIPWPSAHCEASEVCTFASANTFAVTNSYTVAGGLTGKGGLQDFELAFNLGASYTYSTTVTSAQTVTNSRPGNSSGICGYWTFLPYFVSSCGFFIEGERQSGSWANFIGESYHTCSKNFTATFACTNTTYLDTNGNAEGVTVFVQTICNRNYARIDPGVQDPRYVETLSTGIIQVPDAFLFYDRDTDLTSNRWPDSYQACYRGCLCGYHQRGLYAPEPHFPEYQRKLNPYFACLCDSEGVLASMFFQLLNENKIHTPVDLQDNTDVKHEIPITQTNRTLLDFYGVNISTTQPSNYSYPFFTLSKVLYTVQWVMIEEFDNRTIAMPFECFADMNASQHIMADYVETRRVA